MNENHGYGFPDEWASALPGERLTTEEGFSGTATNDYFYAHGALFRRFAWCSDSIANSPAWSPKGEWFAVRGHWKQFKRKAAA